MFTVVVRVARAHETVFIVVLSVFTVPERDAIFTVFADVCPERVFILVVWLATTHERVLTVVVREARFPESVEIVELIPAIVPERAFWARPSVK